MEILSGIGRLADLDIVARRELQEAFDAGAGVLGPLSFVSVREKQHQARQQSPLVFSGAHKLIDHGLRDVGEIAKLRFPQYEGFRIVAAVAVFESHHAGFRERGIVDVAAGLVGCDVPKRHVFRLVLGID